jgi:predicted MFS family arabinose efflux permease
MSDIIPLRSRGTWQGIVNGVWALGMGIGAPLGGYLADTIGWRWYTIHICVLQCRSSRSSHRAFLLQVPIAIAAIISVGLALKVPKPDAALWKDRIARVDFMGALTLVVMLVSLLLSLDRGGNVAWVDPFTIGALAVCAMFASAFIVTEARIAKEPLAPARVVASGTLLASYLCNFFSTAANVTLLFYTSLYLQAVEKRSASDAGTAMFPYIVGVVGGSLFAGILMQITGRYYVLTFVQYFLMLAGTITMTLSIGAFGHSFVRLEIGELSAINPSYYHILTAQYSGMFIMAFTNSGGLTSTLISLIAQAGAKDQAIAIAG